MKILRKREFAKVVLADGLREILQNTMHYETRYHIRDSLFGTWDDSELIKLIDAIYVGICNENNRQIRI